MLKFCSFRISEFNIRSFPSQINKKYLKLCYKFENDN